MSEELGFEKLLAEDGFFGRLFGRSPSGSGREPLYDDLPVVLLTGGPGMGKARLLRALRSRFAAKVPVVRLDCASAVYTDGAAQEPHARSAATELLFAAARQLGEWQGPGGSFAFPRLFVGLAVIATGVSGGTPEAVADEVKRYEEQLDRRSRLRTHAFWRGVLRHTGRNLSQTLAEQALGPLANAVTGPLIDALFADVAPREGGRLTALYGAYPGVGGQPRVGLHELAADFRRGSEEDREQAERFLFRALRADLEAQYTSVLGWLSRVGRPVLLLDHADTPLGQQLLSAVLVDRRGGERDRVVIVATARRSDGGRFLYGGLPSRTVTSPAEFRPADGFPATWSRRTGADPERTPLADGVLLLRMPPLTGDQIRQEIGRRMGTDTAARGGPSRSRVTATVDRLSGGRPHTALRLAAAAADFPMAPDANDRALLDAPLRLARGEARQPVADVLLRELILDQLPVRLPASHHDQWLDLLTHLSVAHDTECADVLLRHLQAGHVHRLTAHHVTDYLADTGWPVCERHFIGDFGLRQLLVHRLYQLRPGGAAWQEDHGLLRDHYAARPAHEGTGRAFRSAGSHRWHHHLVSGGVEDVVGHLAAVLPGRPEEWCAELLEIAQAPYPGGGDGRRARAEGLVVVEGPALRRVVDQLLHAVWLCEERTRPTRRESAATLSTLLGRLTTMDFDGAGQFSRTAIEWTRLAENEQPLLRCSCTDPFGRRG